MRTANAVKTPQPLDAIQPSRNTLRKQLALDLFWAIDATAALMCRLNGNDQTHVFEFVR